VSTAIAWHDVECGSYGADLPLWRELARYAGGPILELGAGTGRVALDLAERGHAVTALDADAELLGELRRRAAARGLTVAVLEQDAREADLADGGFALVIAPMQFLQVVGAWEERGAVLERVARALGRGGRFAAALATIEEAVAPEDAPPPLPDVGEYDGWIYSSLPVDVRLHRGGVRVERLRQLVSPAGELREETHTQHLKRLEPAELEREAAEHGLRPEGRREILPTADHVGSTVVICRR